MSRHPKVDFTTPWHRASFEWCMNEGIPQLLDKRLPLGGITGWKSDDTVTRESWWLMCGLPTLSHAPVNSGLFITKGAEGSSAHRRQSELDQREFPVWASSCEYICSFRRRWATTALGESLLHASPWSCGWNPFYKLAQRLDTTNWLSRSTHLRRLLLTGDLASSFSTHARRVCPIETPGLTVVEY